ncbi:MAG: hypothetical protein AAGL98_00100 [Planctomycetota bacterium]
MMYARRAIIVLATALLFSTPTLAQYQVPAHSVPIGKGVGNTGFGSAAPVANTDVLRDNGPGNDPTFGPLPNPSASTLGGVQAYSAPSNQFLTGISTAGVPQSAQPSFGNLSGSISTSQMNGGASASATTYWRGDGTWKGMSLTSAVDCGADPTGVVDSTSVINSCISTYGGVSLPIGTYLISSPGVNVTSNYQELIGSGTGQTKLVYNSTTGNAVNVAGTNNVVSGFTITRTSGVPTSGAGVSTAGAVNNITLRDVQVENQWNGFDLSNTYYSFGSNLWAFSNYNDGFFANSGTAGLNFILEAPYAGANNGWGFEITTTGSAAGEYSLGQWTNPTAFSNGAGGYKFQGSATAGISNIRIVNLNASSDNGDEIFAQTYGIYNYFSKGLVEQGGTLAAGRGSSIVASHVGNGFNLSHNTNLTIDGLNIVNNSNDGIHTDGTDTQLIVTNNIIAGNSQASVGVNNGVTIGSGSTIASVSGNQIQALGTTQKYGIQSNSSALTLSHNYMAGNTAGCSVLTSTVGVDNTGCAVSVTNSAGLAFNGATTSPLGAISIFPNANRMVFQGGTQGFSWDDAPATHDLMDLSALGVLSVGVSTGGSLALYGATSGSITLKTPLVAGTNTITLPAGTTDFSATGGTSQVVQQSTLGGPFTVGQLAASSLSNGTTGSGAVVLATAPSLTTPVTITGGSAPQLNFNPTSGATVNAQFFQSANNFGIAGAGIGNWELINLTNGNTSMASTTASTSSTTGALTLAGGLGVAGNAFFGGAVGTPVQTTKTANYSQTINDADLIFNCAASCTLTLLAASSYPGMEIWVKTYAAQTVVSASANVIPLTGGAATTSILAATAGKWARLKSNGTNWEIMAAN